MRSVLGIDGGRPAAEDDALGLQRGDLLRRRVVGQDLREHLALADSPRDDLRVLGTEIEDDAASVTGHGDYQSVFSRSVAVPARRS